MTASSPSHETAESHAQPSAPGSKNLRVYVGTYTGGKSKGIYLFQMDPATGRLTPEGVAAETDNPSFLAIHPSRKYLYAVNEVGEFGGQKSGAVSAFAIAPGTGKLTLLNQAASGGDGPCHLTIDKTGRNVLVANYGGGSVAVLPIQPDGRLAKATTFIQHQGSSINKQRQEGPHAHSAQLDAANRFAFVADLGLDRVFVYHFDPNRGALTPGTPPAVSVALGAGPRHFAFHPDGRYAYVIDELNSTVTAFAYDARTGELKTLQAVSTLPEGFIGENSTAEVQVSPNGRFLYGSNRGHNSIAIFAIAPKTGLLNYLGYEPTQGKTPRNFSLDPSGNYLIAANQDSDSLVVFRVDAGTGRLTPTGQVITTPMPVCVTFLKE
jgi:6-phosphogluconolactonase